VVRTTYAHEANLLLEPGADEREPGAAVTVALCGSWEHAGPCPLAPHHTAVDRDAEHLVVRILFATEPEAEEAVRQKISAALAVGRLPLPPDERPGWRLLHHGAVDVADDERDHAARLAEQ
jgi:hypothetical protein